MRPEVTEVRLTRSGNGKPLVDINGKRDWRYVGGEFDAVRLVGGRHPGDWSDLRTQLREVTARLSIVDRGPSIGASIDLAREKALLESLLPNVR